MEELETIVSVTVRRYEWEHLEAGARCIGLGRSAEELVVALQGLYKALHQHDNSRPGYPSRRGQAEFYESGLAAIGDFLKALNSHKSIYG